MRRKKRAKRSVSPGIGRWGDDDEQGYESAESGRIRLRKERSPSVLREEDSDDEDVSGSGSEAEVSSGESGVEDSEDEDEVESDGESEAPSEIEQLHPDSPTRTAQTRIERQESLDQELQSEAGSEDDESEDEKEASSSGAEDNAETEHEAETESEAEAQLETEAESEREAESEVEIESEVKAGSETEVESEAEIQSEVEVESEAEAGLEAEIESEPEVEPGAEVESEEEIESEAEVESEVEDMPEPLDEPEDNSESESEGEPEPEDEDEDEAQFADESQLETQPLYELPPSIHSYANRDANSGPATPSPSDDSDAEEEEEEEESPVPLASPNKRPVAPLDSPFPSDHSEAGAEEDAESHYTDSGEDESEDEFAEIKPTATISSTSKGRPKRAAVQRTAEQQAALRRAVKQAAARRTAARRASVQQAAARRAAERRAPKITGRTRGRQVDVYNSKYIELLNDQIELAASRGLSEIEHDRDRVTQVLGSVWTRRERDMFFKYIAIVGKDNVAELARLIGTKSVVECRAYVKALQDGREHDWHAPAKRWIREREIVSARDIPAAVELSDECVEALEEEAYVLEARIRKDEERREKVKWGDLWRLDAASSWTLEQMYKENEIDEIREIAPEAELLNIYNMLGISERYVYSPLHLFPAIFFSILACPINCAILL
jgi:hypothetical protein